MTTEMFQNIQSDLPKIPIEVIEIWLLPLAKREKVGWPPTIRNDWRYILGKNCNLDYLDKLHWEKRSMELKPEMIIKNDLDMIVQLFSSHVLNEITMFSGMKDGKARFRSSCDFLKEHGVFPKPIVLEKLANGYHVLDGFHRLTSFFYLYGYFNIENDETPCLKVYPEQVMYVATCRDL